jgi:uncharacterized protein
MLRKLNLPVIGLVLLALAASAQPPYRVAHDAPLKAEEKLLEEKEHYALHRVEFNGIAGDRVIGHLYLPKALKGRRPAVLVQHGIGDKKQSAKGVVALAIDAPNRGERRQPGKESVSILDPASVHEWFRQHCGDYSRALDYLATRSEVDAGRLGYIGFSWGAITGITFAAHDARVKALASIGGGGNFGGYLGLAGFSGDGKQAPASLDPAHHIAAFAPRPLLLLNGRRDIIVPPAFASALHKAAGEGSRVEWHDTDHFFSGMDREKILDSVAEFLKQSLETAK